MNRLFRDPLDTGAGGEPTPEQIQEALKTEAYDGDTLKPGYSLGEDGTIIKDELPEGAGPDGEPLDGYQKNEDGTFSLVEEENPQDFFETVEAITGETYEVDYGDVEPDTPEGVAKYVQAVKEKAIEDFEKVLQENIPDAYAYMLHLQTGGTKEEFFQQGSVALMSRADFENNSDAQANLIRQTYQESGVPDRVIQLTIDELIKDNKLKEEALKVYGKYESSQEEQLQRIQKLEQEQTRVFNEQVKTVMSSIDSVVDTNAIRFVIPEAKKSEFSDYVKNMIQHSNGQFYVTQPISRENAQQVVEGLFLQYSGKDGLKKIIEKEARAITTNKLKLRVTKDAATEKGGVQVQHQSSGSLPLSSFIPKKQS